MAFSGALIGFSANQFIGHNATSPYFKAAFDTPVYDAGGWHSAANKRLTVPAGVDRVKVKASLVWAMEPAGIRQIVIWKNGAFCAGLQPNNLRAVPDTTTDHEAISHVIEVNEGDYFEVHPFQNCGYALQIQKSTGTCFSIEAVG